MPGLTGHLSFNRSPVKPGMTMRKEGMTMRRNGDDIMMRWPEIRGFSWLAHGTMALRPEIGRFLWPKRSPVKPGMTDRKAGNCILSTKTRVSMDREGTKQAEQPIESLRERVPPNNCCFVVEQCLKSVNKHLFTYRSGKKSRKYGGTVRKTVSQCIFSVTGI